MTSDQICDLMTKGTMRWGCLSLPSGEHVYDIKLRRRNGRVSVSFTGEDRAFHREVLDRLQDLLQCEKEGRAYAAKTGVSMRARRVEEATRFYAGLYLRGLFGSTEDSPAFQSYENCRICGKRIRNCKAKSRGIGPECWRNVLSVARFMAKKRAEAKAR